MKSLLFGTALFLSVAQQKCSSKSSAAAVVPACIQAKIDSIKKEPQWSPPATVEEYLYKGKRIFLFSSPCCDHFNQAFDAACTYVCAPSGGYTGRGDNRCNDFKDSAKFVKIVWRDERP